MVSEKIIKEIIRKHAGSFDAKVLILLEHEEQVKDCLKWLDEVKGQTQIIALSPFAIYELDKQNIPYKIPEDYYEPGELYHFGLGNYQRIEDFSSLIDKRIHTACPAVAERGIKPALFSLYHLKLIYDAVMVRLFQLSRVINVEKPGIIFVYDDKEYPFGVSETAPYFLFDNRESVYTRLLKLAGWKVPVIALPYVPHPVEANAPQESNQNIKGKFRDRLLKWLWLRPILYEVAVAIRLRAWRGFFRILKGGITGRKNYPVLLYGGPYNWNDCRAELLSAGITPILTMSNNLWHWLSGPLPERMNSRSLPDVWQELKTDDEFRSFFIWQAIDFFPVLEERLQFLVRRLSLACLRAYDQVTEALTKSEVKAFLASGWATCADRSAAQAAHNAGIPVIIWQHGNYGYINQPLVIYNEMMGTDALFVFGDGVVEKYAEPAERLGTKLIPIGSTSLEALNSEILGDKVKKLFPLDSQKRTLLYVTTNFYQNDLYISLSPPFSDNHFWHTQRMILDVMARHRDYNIVVKLSPARGYRDAPLSSYASEKGIENCRFIKDECSFTDLLALADVLVIDFPSTVLLQALTTLKPIFAFTGHLHIDNRAQELLARRTSCHRQLTDFVGALDSFLAGGKTTVDLNDREFLRKFGTSDGMSGKKAATTLVGIIRNHRQ